MHFIRIEFSIRCSSCILYLSYFVCKNRWHDYMFINPVVCSDNLSFKFNLFTSFRWKLSLNAGDFNSKSRRTSLYLFANCTQYLTQCTLYREIRLYNHFEDFGNWNRFTIETCRHEIFINSVSKFSVLCTKWIINYLKAYVARNAILIQLYISLVPIEIS